MASPESATGVCRYEERGEGRRGEERGERRGGGEGEERRGGERRGGESEC